MAGPGGATPGGRPRLSPGRRLWVRALITDYRRAADKAPAPARYGDCNGVQCYFGQPKVAQGGPWTAPPANPTSIDGLFNAAGLRLAVAPRFSYNLVADYQQPIGAGLTRSVQFLSVDFKL